MKYKQIKKIGVEGFSEKPSTPIVLFAYKRKKMFEKRWKFLPAILHKNETWFLFTQFDNLF